MIDNYGSEDVVLINYRCCSQAKKIAAERGVELESLQGSGPGGRVVAQDVSETAAIYGRAIAERFLCGININHS